MIRPIALTLLALAAGAVVAKLPPPSDEAKAKAAEAAAKTAHAGKVDNYKLCLSMGKVAERYQAEAKKAGRAASAPSETPACADPGPFVYTPPAPAAPAAVAAAPAATAAPAPAPAPVAPPAKK
jgi:hypothetical protein